MSVASHQSQSDQTQFCGPHGPYVLTKVSRSGRRYFFNGTLNCIGTEKSGAALVAQTTFEPSAAYQFLTLELPESIANQLNKQGRRKVSPKTPCAPSRPMFWGLNFPIDRQNKVLGPTIDAAYASGADPETIARAVLSGMNSLGLQEQDIPKFLDQIVKGGKEGEFEIEAMAKYFPELGAIYAASGRTGLDASAELIALAQITRKGAGMESGAATNLQNLLSKISAKDAVKNFKDKGVDLKKLSAQSSATGTPYVLSLLSEIERLGGDNEFVLNELYPDMQVKAAIRPLLANKDLYAQIFDAVRNKSGGVVQKDADFLGSRPKAESDRRGAAWGQVGTWLGELWGGSIGPVRDEVLGLLNPDWRRLEEGRTERKRLGGLDLEGLEADISDLKARIDGMPKPREGMPDIHGSGRTNLQLRLREMEDELRRTKDVQSAPEILETLPSNVPRPKPGRVPGKQSSLMPDLGNVAARLEPAGAEAGAKFAAALKTEAERVGTVADTLKDRFSFTATPTISPSFSNGAASTAPVSRSSYQGGPAPVINQNVTGNADPQRTARAVVREQNSAIRRARARSLHDLGALA